MFLHKFEAFARFLLDTYSPWHVCSSWLPWFFCDIVSDSASSLDYVTWRTLKEPRKTSLLLRGAASPREVILVILLLK